MYRIRDKQFEVLLVHPGGPFWVKKDFGAWSIPKGEVADVEDEFQAAKREFEEEIGIEPRGEFVPLGTVTQKSGKVVHAWAFKGDFDTRKIRSSTFEMEWPPRSGEMREFPEVDRAEWFGIKEAKQKINPEQTEFIKRLEEIIKRSEA